MLWREGGGGGDKRLKLLTFCFFLGGGGGYDTSIGFANTGFHSYEGASDTVSVFSVQYCTALIGGRQYRKNYAAFFELFGYFCIFLIWHA